MVLAIGCVCLGRGTVDGQVRGCVVILTTLLGSNIFLSLGCTFLGKGDKGTRDLEGKADGGRGCVTHGDNRGAMKVDGAGHARGVREKD